MRDVTYFLNPASSAGLINRFVSERYGVELPPRARLDGEKLVVWLDDAGVSRAGGGDQAAQFAAICWSFYSWGLEVLGVELCWMGHGCVVVRERDWDGFLLAGAVESSLVEHPVGGGCVCICCQERLVERDRQGRLMGGHWVGRCSECGGCGEGPCRLDVAGSDADDVLGGGECSVSREPRDVRSDDESLDRAVAPGQPFDDVFHVGRPLPSFARRSTGPGVSGEHIGRAATPAEIRAVNERIEAANLAKAVAGVIEGELGKDPALAAAARAVVAGPGSGARAGLLRMVALDDAVVGGWKGKHKDKDGRKPKNPEESKEQKEAGRAKRAEDAANRREFFRPVSGAMRSWIAHLRQLVGKRDPKYRPELDAKLDAYRDRLTKMLGEAESAYDRDKVIEASDKVADIWQVLGIRSASRELLPASEWDKVGTKFLDSWAAGGAPRAASSGQVAAAEAAVAASTEARAAHAAEVRAEAAAGRMGPGASVYDDPRPAPKTVPPPKGDEKEALRQLTANLAAAFDDDVPREKPVPPLVLDEEESDVRPEDSVSNQPSEASAETLPRMAGDRPGLPKPPGGRPKKVGGPFVRAEEPPESDGSSSDPEPDRFPWGFDCEDLPGFAWPGHNPWPYPNVWRSDVYLTEEQIEHLEDIYKGTKIVNGVKYMNTHPTGHVDRALVEAMGRHFLGGQLQRAGYKAGDVVRVIDVGGNVGRQREWCFWCISPDLDARDAVRRPGKEPGACRPGECRHVAPACPGLGNADALMWVDTYHRMTPLTVAQSLIRTKTKMGIVVTWTHPNLKGEYLLGEYKYECYWDKAHEPDCMQVRAWAKGNGGCYEESAGHWVAETVPVWIGGTRFTLCHQPVAQFGGRMIWVVVLSAADRHVETVPTSLKSFLEADVTRGGVLRWLAHVNSVPGAPNRPLPLDYTMIRTHNILGVETGSFHLLVPYKVAFDVASHCVGKQRNTQLEHNVNWRVEQALKDVQMRDADRPLAQALLTQMALRYSEEVELLARALFPPKERKAKPIVSLTSDTITVGAAGTVPYWLAEPASWPVVGIASLCTGLFWPRGGGWYLTPTAMFYPTNFHAVVGGAFAIGCGWAPISGEARSILYLVALGLWCSCPVEYSWRLLRWRVRSNP